MFREVRNVAAERINRGETNYGGRGGGGGGGWGGEGKKTTEKQRLCSLPHLFSRPLPHCFLAGLASFFAKHELKISQENCLIRRLTVIPIV